jgi:hypothetical protein
MPPQLLIDRIDRLSYAANSILSRKDKNRVLELVSQGWTHPELAEMFNVTVWKIKGILRKYRKEN